MDNDNIAAAILAATLITTARVADAAEGSPHAFAAKNYLACLEAIRAERERQARAK